MPICPVCQEIKDITEFYKWRRKCKKCISDAMASYYKKNKEEISLRKKRYRETNKDEINAGRRKKYSENKTPYLERASDYYYNNREDVLTRAKENIIKRKSNDFITFKLRRIYAGIKHRCNNPNDKCYKYYWWKWVKCLRKTFEDFYNDMHTSYKEHYDKYGEMDTQIDRIDNNWNYCKSNCRRVTAKENHPINKAKEFTS